MATENQGASTNQQSPKEGSTQSEPLKSASSAAESTTKDDIVSGKEAVQAAYDKVLEAKEHFKVAAQAAGIDLRSEVTQELLKGRDKAQAISDQAGIHLREKPLVTLSAVFLAGFLLSLVCTKKEM